MTLRLTLLGLLILVAPALTFAWTGPSATAPNSNASAPINVGAVDQVKSANLGVNGIAVFGNSLLGGAAGSNAYLNFGATAGSSGYGIRDNAGALEFKNSGGSWQTLQSVIAGLGGSWTTSGSNIYNANSGNVGIGMSGPSNKLHVTGNIGATGWIGAGCEGACESSGGYSLMYADGSIVTRGAPSWAIDSRGVYGVYGEGGSYGVYGQANGGGNGVTGNAPSGIGVRGYGSSWGGHFQGGNGVYGHTDGGGQAVQGYSAGGWGGYFQGANGLHAINHSGYYSQIGTGAYGLYTNGAIYVHSGPAGYWAGDFRSTGSHGIHTSNANGYWSYVAYSSYGILTNGNIYGAAFYYYSDARLKKNVATITGSLQKVLGMRGVSYELIDQSTDISKGTQLGLIAQEVEKVAPEVVRTDENGIKAIDYPRVVPILVEAIKEQNGRIDAQQVEIDELKSAIVNLTNSR